MNCKSPTIQGYESHTRMIEHGCHLPHTGQSLALLLVFGFLILCVGIGLLVAFRGKP